MKNEQELKQLVKEKYSEIANRPRGENLSSCCGATACCDDAYTIMADEYHAISGYVPEADLGLGCGLPTEYAHIKAGDTVVDLGSGAGNDIFVARQLTGNAGKCIGVDFTEAMVARARANAEKLGYQNVEFRLGDIESLPISSNLANVVVSNCVLNLVPNKHKVFSEIYRILKPGAHFSISDIVLEGSLPENLRAAAEMHAGCVSGAIPRQDYLGIVKESGFEEITIQKEKPIIIPEAILLQYLTPEELKSVDAKDFGIASITVFARKPAKDDRECCPPESGCC